MPHRVGAYIRKEAAARSAAADQEDRKGEHMSIRSALLTAATAAALIAPALPSLAQTASPAPTDQPAAHRGEHRQMHSEWRQKYEQLSAADKQRFNELQRQIRDLRQQQAQILGVQLPAGRQHHNG
jgi:TolA-binding protein